MGEEPRATIPWYRGWAPVFVLPAAVALFTPADWPRWVFMWLLGGAVFVGCKWLTWRRTPTTQVPAWRHLAYLLAWPGLDAAAFLKEPLPADERPKPAEWISVAVKVAAGALLLWGIAPRLNEAPPLSRGWVGMIGIVLIMHFGGFHWLSCLWRSAGVQARRLMNSPLLAEGVSDFWGRRWNVAFRDLTHRFLFRPLTARLGPRWGVIAGFVFSGLIHELVISVPAQGGYGGPTLFFALQIPALFIERSRFGRAVGLGSGWRGWLFTALVLVPPAGLLFHPPFVLDVILPFWAAIGA